jgi:hypothetical protein
MVRYLTMNGNPDNHATHRPFALRYRRVNGTFYRNIEERRVS